MDETQTARFRTLIVARLAQLDEEDVMGRAGQATVVLDQQAVGRLSRQDALLNQSMAKATQARRDAARLGLNAALARIDEGEYGYCEECGDDIASKRLELDPAVRLCISCANG